MGWGKYLSKKVAIVIVNHNNQDDVLRICSELKFQTFQDFFILVVDDNSSEISILEELNESSDFVLVHYPEPFKVGYANKHNKAFVEAVTHGAKFIFKMHTDMQLISNDLLESLVRTIESDESVACVGPTIFSGTGQKTWGPGIIKKRCGFDIRVQESYLVRSSYLVDFDGFQDEVFDWFGEEMDFIIRVERAGFKVKQIEEGLTHFGGGASSAFRLKKCMYRADSSLVFLFKYRKRYSVIEIIHYYIKELRSELMFVRNEFNSLRIISGFKGLSLIIVGFLTGAYKVTRSKYKPLA